MNHIIFSQKYDRNPFGINEIIKLLVKNLLKYNKTKVKIVDQKNLLKRFICMPATILTKIVFLLKLKNENSSRTPEII